MISRTEYRTIKETRTYEDYLIQELFRLDKKSSSSSYDINTSHCLRILMSFCEGRSDYGQVINELEEKTGQSLRLTWLAPGDIILLPYKV